MSNEVISGKISQVKKELRSKTMAYVAGGFGLVAGLAWNDAIKSFIELVFPRSGDSVTIKFVYAGAITVVVVVIIMSLGRFLKDDTDVVK